MLSPRFLEGISDELVEIYDQLENDILIDMAKRLAELGRLEDITEWQAQMLVEMGGLKQNITKILKKYDPWIVNAITRAYDKALRESTKMDNIIFKEATGRTVKVQGAQKMLAEIQKARADLSRLTLTTAADSEQQFIKQANRMYMQMSSGAFNYQKSLATATDELSAQGITMVQYRNTVPVRRSIEAAVRMNILTGINQTASTVTLNNAQELGADLVETTAHLGARPEHAAWQGRVFSLSGNNPKYPPFEVCGYGTATGICGINCRHSFYPYFEGLEKHYTAEELDEIGNEKVTLNGEQVTRYEAEQELRKIERNVRKYGRRAVTQEAAGLDDTSAREYLGKWKQKALELSKETGICRDLSRERIGTPTGRQPSAIYKK